VAEELQEEQSLSIKELIRRVQRELIASQKEREAANEEALFQVDKLDLEVHFVVTKSTKAEGGFSLQVLTLGGFHAGTSRNSEEQQVQKLTLSLKAASPDHRERSWPIIEALRRLPSRALGSLPRRLPDGMDPRPW
jgi:hypothetical protein